MPESPKPFVEQGRPPRIAVETAVHWIEQDFQRAIDTLARVLEVVESSDKEVAVRVRSMKEFAERGVELSRQLLELMSHKPD